MRGSKGKKMVIEWPGLGARIKGDFLNELNPELCAAVQANLPIETIQSHGVIGGGFLMAPTRIVCTVPPRCVEKFNEQPIGRINFSLFYLALSLKYGLITEFIEIPPIAQVLRENIDVLIKVGKQMWEHTCNLSPDKGYIRSIFRLSS